MTIHRKDSNANHKAYCDGLHIMFEARAWALIPRQPQVDTKRKATRDRLEEIRIKKEQEE